MNEKTVTLKSQTVKIDLWLMVLAAALVLFGLLAIYDATVIAAFRDFGDKLFYFKNSGVFVCGSLL